MDSILSMPEFYIWWVTNDSIKTTSFHYSREFTIPIKEFYLFYILLILHHKFLILLKNYHI